MEKQRMDRISELTAIARQRELTADEQAERKILREEYLESWRISTKATLDNTYLVDDEGNKNKLIKKKK